MSSPVRNRTVIGPAGGEYTVLTDEEERAFNGLVAKYQSDNHFQNVSDLQDLERIIYIEVISARYMNWLTEDQDYSGEIVDGKALSRTVTDFSGELRQLKKAVGIDRASRLKDSNESVADYIENLRQRAKEFGIHREEQLTKALTLFNELSALITLHDNCTPEERRDLKVELDHIIGWIREVAIPEYEELDRHFIQNTQKFWIRDM